MIAWAGAKLHLGCGAHRLAGWVNLDGKAAPGVDVVMDLHELGPSGVAGLPDDALTWIYTSHVIEHLAVDVLPIVLRHLHRGLRPGGRLTIATTDLDGIYRHRYLSPDNGAAWEAAMFGRQTSDAHPYDLHRDCFTYAKLEAKLLAAGFRVVRPWRIADYPEIFNLNDYARSCALVTCFAEGVK